MLIYENTMEHAQFQPAHNSNPISSHPINSNPNQFPPDQFSPESIPT